MAAMSGGGGTAAAWCEPEALLTGMYNFTHLSCSASQSPGDIASFCGILQRSITSLGNKQWLSKDGSELSAMKKAAGLVGAPFSHVGGGMEWFPEYGCALLALPVHSTQAVPEQVTVLLVGLDAWEFRLHSTSESTMQDTANCTGSVELPVGSVPAAELQEFTTKLRRLIAKAEQRVRDERSSLGSKRQGHQKTPAMVLALSCQALAIMAAEAAGMSGEDVPECAPRGGTTDVGLHTGGTPRNTAWLLVREAFKTALGQAGCSPDLFHISHSHLHLWLLQRQVQLVTPATATSQTLNAAMQMLNAAASLAADMAEKGIGGQPKRSAAQQQCMLAELEAGCTAARRALEAAAGQRAWIAADAATLPALTDAVSSCGSYSLPRGLIPPAQCLSAEGTDLEAAKRRAAANLGSLPLCAAAGGAATWAGNLLESVKLCVSLKIGSIDDMASQQALSMVEAVLFSRAADRLAEGAVLGEGGVNDLAAVLDVYRKEAEAFLATPQGAARMHVELRSRAVLVTWIAACMTHAAVGRTWPWLLQQYGIGLRYQDLQHLVLSDRAAVDALLGVAAYIKSHTRPGKGLFTLVDGGAATLQMAAQFAAADQHILAAWQQEEAAAESRRSKHWVEVQRKQQLAAQKQAELVRLQAAEAEAKRLLDGEEVRQSLSSYRHYDDTYLIRYRTRYNSAVSARQATESELQDALKPPTPVIQPLPKQQTPALQWLFFLNMPQLLRHLSRFTFLAQQLLLPPATEPVRKCIEQPMPAAFTTSHYNSFQKSPYLSDPGRRGTDGRVLLVSRSAVPSPAEVLKQHGLTTVDNYHSQWNGIWHPDSLKLHLGWRGSGVADGSFTFWFNPFAPVPHALVVDSFTEQLPAAAAALQWAMPQYGFKGTSADRSGQPVAKQDQKPLWLSKPAFLAFGGLRSYPLTQMWQLAVALRERSLPLGHPAVQLLVRQALWHVGELTAGTSNEPPSLLWRTDWGGSCSEQGDWLKALCADLAALEVQLRDSPREHASMLLLGELAAYLSAWYPPFHSLQRQMAATAARWADAVEKEVAQAPPLEATVLRARQCLLRMTALQCYRGGGGGGPLASADARHMLCLAAQVHHGSVHAHGLEDRDQDLRLQIARLEVLCHWTMARRAAEIVAAATADRSMLTAALRSVIPRAPEKLSWVQLALVKPSTDTASFQAVSSCGHLYSINCLNGTVLEDGSPPGRLPTEILSHSLYLRSFTAYGAPWGFEVASIGSGVYKTLAPVRGRYYEFRLAGDGALVVAETDGQNNRLELLDPGVGEACSPWGDQLPPRLRKLHSHWLSRDCCTIVVRKRHFREHSTDFLLRWEQPTAAAQQAPVDFCCLRVPPHQQSRHWADLQALQGPDALQCQLVLHSSTIVLVLSQFEWPEFIHTFADARSSSSSSSSSNSDGGSWTMLFDLPRFALEFELRGDGLWSRDFAGCRLHACQRLTQANPRGLAAASSSSCIYTLPNFGQYLVLEQAGPLHAGSAGQQRGQLQILVPAGRVQRASASQAVTVQQPAKDCEAQLKHHMYAVHPRLAHLHSDSIPARMQLAALYAATGSLLPEPGSQATGVQLAMRIVRQCWSVQPPGSPAATFLLAEADLAQLRDAAELGGHMAAGLRLLVHDVLASSAQLHSLHFADCTPEQASLPELPPDWQKAYLQERSRNWRLLLTDGEERRTLGRLRQPPEPALWQRLGLCQPIELPPCPLEAGVVASAEAALQALLVPAKGAPYPNSTPPYPLRESATPLSQAMHAELKDSWQTYHRTLSRLEGEVSTQRAMIEALLLSHLATAPQSLGLHGAAFRMRQAAGTVPLPSLRDLFELAKPERSGSQINPFLSSAATAQLRSMALLWLQLCVLEDKLQRLAAWVDDPAEAANLLQELSTHRTWDPAAHPLWLVFEAEQQLQIRPAQHWVAAHLIAHPQKIVQLNMGEGKTRVILPMLILHFADGKQVVRLNFLPALINEAFSHLHGCMCASVLERKLHVLPFHRDVSPMPELLAAMQSMLEHCKQECGMLLTTPERRLSLVLKRQEMWQRGGQEAVCGQLDAVLGLAYADILDESDELLSHKYQLVYAWGAARPLDSTQIRLLAGQVLLGKLSRHVRFGTIRALLMRERVAVLPRAAGRKPGAYSGPALLPGDALEAALPELRRLLAEAVLDDPPYEMRWMQRFWAGSAVKDSLLSCVLERSVDLQPVIEELELSAEESECVLALRGLLGFGVLEHCLQLRVNVNFGINRARDAPTPLAVPFRAAHEPAPRTQYTQPDAALCLTGLAYYSDGLSPKQLVAAVVKLLGLGRNVQRDQYGEWLALAAADLSSEELAPVDDVNKLDPSNSDQMILLHQLFSHNMAAINFWLASCVVPDATRVYEGRLGTSAWHLADSRNGFTVGFSGTNDNYRLLPLQVRQQLQVEPGLHTTNGKMLAMLLQTPFYDTLAPKEEEHMWQALLRFAVDEGLDALIDCGALLAGTTNRLAAEHLAELLITHAPRWLGVCYYDEQDRAWMVLDLQGRRLRREVSPIREAQAFAIFDEARCRGTDLKLRSDAVGLLTLGPTTCKDKFMQAAGRLRKLGKGQTLQITGTINVTAKIKAAAVAAQMPGADEAGHRLTAQHVLQWVMEATVSSVLHGVLEWAHQGLLFAATRNAPERVLQPEKLGLGDLYGCSCAPLPLSDVVATQRVTRQQGGLEADMASLMCEVEECAAVFGKGHSVMAYGGVGEECEREAEREEEEEEELERQVPRATAAMEVDWCYERALGAGSLKDLKVRTGLKPVSMAIVAAQLHPACVADIPWSPLAFCTPNFVNAVNQAVGESLNLNEYLRRVDALLLLPAPRAANGSSKGGHSVLLLTDREANALLDLLWRQQAGRSTNIWNRAAVRNKCVPLLASLSYAWATQQLQGGAPVPLRLAAALVESTKGSWAAGQLAQELQGGAFMGPLTSIQLFNGETTYSPPLQPGTHWSEIRQLAPLRALRELASGRATAAEELVSMRGKSVFWLQSQLERTCNDARHGAAD